ncbi:PepSY domain-containing protein [Agrobacterium vitis]|uniref:PepSY domain-containing protein n=1 Tax=Agrobacterium vitis TaxID=373 RepID=UPI0012E71B4A|nr:PepSY domain-containing protein [Agrobacterium vitis]MVA25731.1 PepSY domain-containing protein [Agrobacterium vitis]
MKIVLIALSITLALAGTTLAGGKCAVPLKEWQPRESLQRKLEGEGWNVRSIRSGDGCYEAHAIDSSGNAVEAYFDPKTFKPVDEND